MLVSVDLDADFSRGVHTQQCNRHFPRPTLYHRFACIDFGRPTLAAHRSRFMQNRGSGFPRMHLPLRLVNKLVVDAPKPSRWHHAHGVDPVE
jgi:hypothetical protein